MNRIHLLLGVEEIKKEVEIQLNKSEKNLST